MMTWLYFISYSLPNGKAGCRANSIQSGNAVSLPVGPGQSAGGSAGKPVTSRGFTVPKTHSHSTIAQFAHCDATLVEMLHSSYNRTSIVTYKNFQMMKNTRLPSYYFMIFNFSSKTYAVLCLFQNLIKINDFLHFHSSWESCHTKVPSAFLWFFHWPREQCYGPFYLQSI